LSAFIAGGFFAGIVTLVQTLYHSSRTQVLAVHYEYRYRMLLDGDAEFPKLFGGVVLDCFVYSVIHIVILFVIERAIHFSFLIGWIETGEPV
jgi:hypothetical protein